MDVRASTNFQLIRCVSCRPSRTAWCIASGEDAIRSQEKAAFMAFRFVQIRRPLLPLRPRQDCPHNDPCCANPLATRCGIISDVSRYSSVTGGWIAPGQSAIRSPGRPARHPHAGYIGASLFQAVPRVPCTSGGRARKTLSVQGTCPG